MTFFEWFYKVVIVQSICVILILLSVVTMKYLFKEEYVKIKDFYQTEILNDTDVNEVLLDEI